MRKYYLKGFPAVIGSLGSLCLIIGGVLGISPLVVVIVEVLIELTVMTSINFSVAKMGVSVDTFSSGMVIAYGSFISADSYE